MKNTVTSGKTTGSTAEKKQAAASEGKAAAPRAVAKTKLAAAKETLKAASVSVAPEISEAPAQAVKNIFSQEQIATQAYLLWEATGYEHGRHEEHWLNAEKLLAAGKAE